MPDLLTVARDGPAGQRFGRLAGDAVNPCAPVGHRFQGVSAEEVGLAKVDERPETRGPCGHCAVDVGAVVEDGGLYASDVHAVEADVEHAVAGARGRNVGPQRLVVHAGAGVDLEAQFSGPASARNQHRLPAHRDLAGVEVAKALRHAGVAGLGQHVERLRSLDLMDPGLGVGDLDVHAETVGARPADEVAVGLDVPEPVLPEPDQDAVDQHAPVGPAGHAVGAAAGLHLRHVTGEQAIEQTLGVRPAELGGELAGVEPHDAPAQCPVGPEPTAGGHGDRHHAPVVDDPGRAVRKGVTVERRALVAVVPARFRQRADEVAPGDEMTCHGRSYSRFPGPTEGHTLRVPVVPDVRRARCRVASCGLSTARPSPAPPPSPACSWCTAPGRRP